MTTCPPHAEDGWNCLPTLHYEDQFGEHGSGEQWVYPAYVDADGDTYQSIETHIDQTSGYVTDSNGWRNERTVEWCDFDDSVYEFQKHGPGTYSGLSSSGFSVGVSAGLPKGVSGSLGWSWSTEHSHTDITESKLGGEHIKHTWEYKKGKDVSKYTVQCRPGYQTKRYDSTDKMKFEYDTKWKFRDYKLIDIDDIWWKKLFYDYETYY